MPTAKRQFVKIGRPGYRIQKIRDPITTQTGLLFQVQFPEIAQDIKPHVRFMSAFEQKVEEPDKDFQYVVIAAEPYNTISFKLPAREVDRRDDKFWTWYDEDQKEYFVQMLFKTEREERYSNVPGLAPLAKR